MKTFNLLKLVNGKINRPKDILALEKLADATAGPLRFSMTDAKPRLGVRTWGQFFEEYFLNDHLYIELREKETSQAVNFYVKTFRARPVDKLANAKQKTGSAERLNQIIVKLKAKANGCDFTPELLKSAHVPDATTQPIFRDPKLHYAKIKTFDEKLVIPEGLSMGTVPIRKVMADRRFEASFAVTISSKYGKAESIRFDQGSTEYSEDQYYEFYKSKLNTVDITERSVAIELVSFENNGVSSASRDGAWRAASDFVAKRKEARKPTSVFLRVEIMPDVEVKRAQASKSNSKSANRPNQNKDPALAKQESDKNSLLIPNGDNDADSESED